MPKAPRGQDSTQFALPHVPVAIAGAGVTGLAAAHRLTELGVSFLLLERSPRCGGVVLTERREGFLLEAGPDSFLARKPWMVDLCRRLGIEDRLLPTDPANQGSFIWHAGRLHALPEGLTSLVPTRLRPLARTRLLSPAGKARLALEPLVPRAAENEDESLAAFFRRRLGGQASRRLVEPLLRGIYGGAPESLSLRATFPQLAEMERRHGSLIRGLLRESRESSENGGTNGSENGGTSGRSGGGFLSLREGMGSLIENLVERLPPGSLRCGTALSALTRRTSGRFELWLERKERLLADAVLLATPAGESARLIGSNDGTLAALLAGIRAGSSLIVSIGFPRTRVRHPLRGYGFVVPERPGAPLLACTWSSSKFSGRAPDGLVLLRAFLSQPDTFSGAHEGRIVETTVQALRPILGLEGAPVLVAVHRWNQALPRYAVGHPQRMREIERRLAKHPGLFLTGASYRGLGIPDCIRDGEAAAEAAAAFVSGGRVPVA
jgi:oxygen-dependent protoporphyrinogen oxidase